MNTTPVDSSGARPPKRLYEGLQYWRGIGAMMVVYFHAVIQANAVYGGNEWMPLTGSSGVDIFFVLSGFVMWVSTAGRDMTPGQFMLRRISRIVPLYWIVSIAAGIAALLIPNMLRSTMFDLPHFIASLLFVPWQNPMAFVTGNPEIITPIVVPGWTLNFEMLFYVLFALALLAPRRRRLLAVTLLVLLTFCVSTLFADTATAFEFYANDMIFEFLAGVFIAAMVAQRATLHPTLCWALIAIALAALLGLNSIENLPYPRALALGIPAALIIAASAQLEVAGRMPRLPLLGAMGDASYSIYLTHIFVIAGLRIAFSLVGVQPYGPAQAAGVVAVAMILSAAVGWMVYKWIELPSVAVAKRLLRA